MTVTILENRIGLIGDVHAEDALLSEAIRRLADAGIETILCTGDIADGPGDVDRACELLAAHHVLTVSGNHDRWVLTDSVRNLPDAVRRDELASKTLAYMRALPRTREFSSRFGRVLLCHGLGTNDMAGVSPDDFGYALESNLELQRLMLDGEVSIVLNGHTHKPMLRRFGQLTIVNAGTLFRKHNPGYVVVDFSAGDVVWHALEGSAADQRALGCLRARDRGAE
ncbi:MAG: metallophosphoesterase family protein [Polyangiaceae bacterium]|nr:metallophosphoesterase family protein [Polyangiaceae bacterium]